MLAGTSVSAHRHDELLQAARIGIGEQRVQLELSLTPGIAVADAIITEIDRNYDGSLSDEEGRAYADQAMRAMQLAVDGRRLRVEMVAARFPAIEALRGGDSSIELRAVATLPSLPSGAHRVSFENAYRREIGVYLTNALVPENGRIAITAQQRDPDQRSTTIEYRIASRSSAMLPLWLLAPGAAAWVIVRRRLLVN